MALFAHLLLHTDLALITMCNHSRNDPLSHFIPIAHYTLLKQFHLKLVTTVNYIAYISSCNKFMTTIIFQGCSCKYSILSLYAVVCGLHENMFMVYKTYFTKPKNSFHWHTKTEIWLTMFTMKPQQKWFLARTILGCGCNHSSPYTEIRPLHIL